MAILVFLLIRAGYDRVPFAKPPGDRQLLAAATGLNLVLVVLADINATGSMPLGSLGGGTVVWEPWAFAALGAAMVAAASAWLPVLRPEHVRDRGTQPDSAKMA